MEEQRYELEGDMRPGPTPPKKHKRKKHECLYVDYTVRRPDGVMVNSVQYTGKVNVPTCLASILTEQDQHWFRTEGRLMRNNGQNDIVVASYKG